MHVIPPNKSKLRCNDKYLLFSHNVVHFLSKKEYKLLSHFVFVTKGKMFLTQIDDLTVKHIRFRSSIG